MWLKKNKAPKETDAPEKLRYSRYYEHDGILRAYANRAMMLAFLCVPTTMLALAWYTLGCRTAQAAYSAIPAISVNSTAHRRSFRIRRYRPSSDSRSRPRGELRPMSSTAAIFRS